MMSLAFVQFCFASSALAGARVVQADFVSTGDANYVCEYYPPRSFTSESDSAVLSDGKCLVQLKCYKLTGNLPAKGTNEENDATAWKAWHEKLESKATKVTLKASCAAAVCSATPEEWIDCLEGSDSE